MIDTCSDRKLIEDYMERGLYSLENVRVKIAEQMGEIMNRLIMLGLSPTLMVIGGDTLFHFVRKVKCRQISLLSELEKGVVYSRMKIGGNFYGVISKSGGFGDEALLVRLIEKINGERRSENAETIFFEDARQGVWG